MDIKEFKQNVINEIKTKLVSIIEEPNFSTKLFKQSREYQQYKYSSRTTTFNNLKDIVHRGSGIMHLPLTLLLNPEHEYSKRYKNHFIRINAKKYMERMYENLTDIVDITSSTYNSTTLLADRPIETILAMNMAIMSINDLHDSIDSRINNITSQFVENAYVKVGGSAIYKITNESTLSLDRNFIAIHGVSLCQTPSVSKFGSFDTHEQTITIRIDDIQNAKTKIITLEEVKESLNNVLQKAIKTKNKDIEACENTLATMKKTLESLQEKQNNLSKLLYNENN